MFNQVILIGRITKEPELLGSEKQYLRNGIAVKNNYKNYKGEYETSFFNFVAFGKTAEFIGKYIHKGDLLLLKCHLSISKMKNENKIEVPVNDIIVDEIQKLNSALQNNNVNSYDLPYETKPKTETQNNFFDTTDNTYDINSDDLPF